MEEGATVLELYRRHELKTRYDAAEFMALRGMRFRTIARLKVPAAVHASTPYYSHWGVRPLGYQFTHDDYRAYEYRVRCTLSRPKWRAAILHGGIVWRVALEMLAEDTKALICQGPDWLMAHLGERFRPREGTIGTTTLSRPRSLISYVASIDCTAVRNTSILAGWTLTGTCFSDRPPILGSVVVSQGAHMGWFSC